MGINLGFLLVSGRTWLDGGGPQGDVDTQGHAFSFSLFFALTDAFDDEGV
jgi:hypothetical protein